VTVLLLYLLSLPNGTMYSNAVSIILHAGKTTNINTNGSYVINVSDYPTLYFFNKYYLPISNMNLSDAFMVLRPINESYYYIILYGNPIITPIDNKNITFEIFNSTIVFSTYNTSTSYTFITSQNTQKPQSVYSNKNTTMIIFNSSIIKQHPITITYNPANAVYYQNITVSCTSNLKYMVMKDNYGYNKTSNSESVTINTESYPGLKVSCYNGYNYITKEFNFSMIKPTLKLYYSNKNVSCVSSFDSPIYLYLNNKTVSYSLGSLNYKVTVNPPFSLKCESPGNQYQVEVSQILNVS